MSGRTASLAARLAAAVVGLQTDDGGSRDPDAALVRLQLTVWEQQL
ncbi:hypothetical protein AB0323_13815 [Arthrobacter sp. NPDC080031]